MKTDKLVTDFISEPLHFYKRVNGSDVDIHDFCILNDNLVEVVFKRNQEYELENKHTNIFIGIFTTARLELYHLMETLWPDLLYVDTDSCVYVSRP